MQFPLRCKYKRGVPISMNKENKVIAVSLGIGFQYNDDIQIESSELFAHTNADSVKIKHLNEHYVLEKTKNGKLILKK